jgi:hypothetical protein
MPAAYTPEPIDDAIFSMNKGNLYKLGAAATFGLAAIWATNLGLSPIAEAVANGASDVIPALSHSSALFVTRMGEYISSGAAGVTVAIGTRYMLRNRAADYNL